MPEQLESCARPGCPRVFVKKYRATRHCSRGCAQRDYNREYQHRQKRSVVAVTGWVRQCRGCGREFIALHGNQQYDTPKCRQAAKKANRLSFEERHPERVKANRHRQYHRNIEKSRAESRDRARNAYAADPEKFKERHKRWVRENSEKAKASERACRQKKRATANVIGLWKTQEAVEEQLKLDKEESRCQTSTE